jgi:hypothetical protein
MKTIRTLLLLSLGLILASACSPAPGTEAPIAVLATATDTKALTPSPSLTTTLTPFSSPTATPDPAILQLEDLRQASLNYLAADQAAAQAVVDSLNIAPGAIPANISAPLALAQLQEAGLVSKYLNLHDYWLLDLAQDGDLLERTFPREQFEWLKVDEPLNSVDFNQQPLQAGDLLHIYPGQAGDDYFAITLVVNRVDELGRAYSVLPHNTPDGFIIQETLLYDPAQPGQGIFYARTDPDNLPPGLTGFGGYDLWRPKVLPYYADVGDPLLAEPIDEAIAASGGDWYILIQELDGEILYSRQADTSIRVDKMIHLPIAMLFLKSLEANHITAIKNYITNMRDYETSLRQTMLEMLAYGSDPAASSLVRTIPQYNLNVNETLQTWNAADTNIPYSLSSMVDLVRLMGGLYNHELLSDESSTLILDMLDLAVLSDNPLRENAPEGSLIYDKRVMIAGDGSMLGELAVIKTGDKTYLVSIFGLTTDLQPASYTDLVEASHQIARIFWEYAQSR